MDQPYSVWADLLNKFHTASDGIQALWLMVVPGMTWTVMRGVTEMVALLRDRGEPRGRLVHAVYEDEEGRLLVYRGGKLIGTGPLGTAAVIRGRAPARDPE